MKMINAKGLTKNKDQYIGKKIVIDENINNRKAFVSKIEQIEGRFDDILIYYESSDCPKPFSIDCDVIVES